MSRVIRYKRLHCKSEKLEICKFSRAALQASQCATPRGPGAGVGLAEGHPARLRLIKALSYSYKSRSCCEIGALTGVTSRILASISRCSRSISDCRSAAVMVDGSLSLPPGFSCRLALKPARSRTPSASVARTPAGVLASSSSLEMVWIACGASSPTRIGPSRPHKPPALLRSETPQSRRYQNTPLRLLPQFYSCPTNTPSRLSVADR